MLGFRFGLSAWPWLPWTDVQQISSQFHWYQSDNGTNISTWYHCTSYLPWQQNFHFSLNFFSLNNELKGTDLKLLLPSWRSCDGIHCQVIATSFTPQPIAGNIGWQAARCLSRLLVIGANASPPLPVGGPGRGTGTGEIDGSVCSRTDNTWFRLQGSCSSAIPSHTPPPVPQMLQEAVLRGRWTVPLAPCKWRATFGDNPWTIEPTQPRVLCTTWSTRQPHLGIKPT